MIFLTSGRKRNWSGISLRLASSDLYPNQAFRYGANAYAFQFHIEVSVQMITEWMAGEDIDHETLTAETMRLYDVYQKKAVAFYGQFFGEQLLPNRR